MDRFCVVRIYRNAEDQTRSGDWHDLKETMLTTDIDSYWRRNG
jgi:hypothetical protein